MNFAGECMNPYQLHMMYLVPLEFHEPFGPSISIIFQDARTKGSWSTCTPNDVLALIYILTPLSLSRYK